MLSYESFDDSWGKSYRNFIILDIKLCFTCEESNSHGKTVSCKVMSMRIGLRLRAKISVAEGKSIYP